MLAKGGGVADIWGKRREGDKPVAMSVEKNDK